MSAAREENVEVKNGPEVKKGDAIKLPDESVVKVTKLAPEGQWGDVKTIHYKHAIEGKQHPCACVRHLEHTQATRTCTRVLITQKPPNHTHPPIHLLPMHRCSLYRRGFSVRSGAPKAGSTSAGANPAAT